jgi:hypothetical protein
LHADFRQLVVYHDQSMRARIWQRTEEYRVGVGDNGGRRWNVAANGALVPLNDVEIVPQ